MSKKESQVSRLADDILMLSHLEPASDRVSWLAPGARGFEPYNEYLIRHGDKTLLLDTGVALHGEQLIASLKELVGSRELIIFITRIELDCIGNLGRVLDHFRDAQVVTANVVPPIGLVHVSAGTTPRTASRVIPSAGRSATTIPYPSSGGRMRAASATVACDGSTIGVSHGTG